MSKCLKCPVYPCCTKLCAERENEIFKQFRMDGKIEIETKLLSPIVMVNIVTSMKYAVNNVRTYEDNSKEVLVIQDMSPEGKLKQIRKEKFDAGKA